MAKKSLDGLRILNTRPKDQAGPLSAAIISAGGQVIEYPTLNIVPTEIQWIEHLPPLHELEIAIFVSPNAVRFAFQVMKQFNMEWPLSIHTIAVGQATANSLKKQQVQVHEIPDAPDSEHLIQLNSLLNIENKRVLLFKGVGGRELIEEHLIKQKARLYLCPVYQREIPSISPKITASIWQDDRVDIILITSEDSMHNLFKLFGKQALNWLCNKPCVVLSQRLAEKAKHRGIKQIVISRPDHLIDTLIDYYQGLSMAKNKQEAKESISSDITSTTQTTPGQLPQEHSKAQGKNLLMGATCVVAGLAITVSVYTLGLNQQLQKQFDNERTQLVSQLNELKQQQLATQNTSLGQSETLKKSQTELNTQLSQLNNELQSALKQHLYQNQDWLLLKARYYLELADINEHWSTSPDASVALLEEADRLLKQMNNSSVLQIRQAIAQEVLQLKAMPSIDIAGLLSQLDAAQITVSDLAIQATIDESNDESVDENNEPKSSNPSAWKSRLQDSLNLLEKMVVVRRNDERAEPLMSPLFESILRESIRLNLQEAQWAILNNNPVVYKLALKQALTGLNRVFDEQSKGAKALIAQLKKLEATPISPEKPAQGQALPMLNELINKNQLINQTTKNHSGETEL